MIGKARQGILHPIAFSIAPAWITGLGGWAVTQQLGNATHSLVSLGARQLGTPAAQPRD